MTTWSSALPAALLSRGPSLLPVLLCAGWLLGAFVAVTSLFLPTWEAQRFGLFYLAPMVPAVVLWARERLAGGQDYSRAALALDCSAFVLAATRTVSGVLPFSGHMLFLTHALLTVRSTGLRLLMAVLWLETAYFKLVLWNDPLSWAVGLILGAVLGLAFRLCA